MHVVVLPGVRWNRVSLVPGQKLTMPLGDLRSQAHGPAASSRASVVNDDC